eukprot:256656_1
MLQLIIFLIYARIWFSECTISNTKTQTFDPTQYTLYFNTYDFALNDAHNWDWITPPNSTSTRACTKQFSNLCIIINATRPGFIIQYNHQQYNMFNDDDFTQFDMTYPLHSIIPQPQQQPYIRGRQLLSDNNMDMYANMDEAEFLGFIKKIGRGIKNAVGGIAGRFGLSLRPPCSSASRCRVHLYDEADFRKRSNKKGHFCEGKWDRWKLMRYSVRKKRISSMKVQGAPCCVAIAYNGDKMDGDLQAMYPRGRYRSMTQGIATGMGTGNGMNGLDHPILGMVGGGLGMNGANKEGFQDKALASLRVVHDCTLMQNLLQRHMHGHGGHMHGRGGMHGMYGGQMQQMQQMQQMMQMMKMMFPEHYGHASNNNKKHRMCRYYSCIVKTQQSQLQQLMQTMMMTAMANQAPIIITDHTKPKPAAGRRRMINAQFGAMGFPSLSGNGSDILLSKCVIVDKNEICGVYNFKDKSMVLRYIIGDTYKRSDKSDMNMNDNDNGNDVNHDDNNLMLLYMSMLNEWYGIWRNWAMFDYGNQNDSSDDYDDYSDGYDFKTVIWSDIDSELE